MADAVDVSSAVAFIVDDIAVVIVVILVMLPFILLSFTVDEYDSLFLHYYYYCWSCFCSFDYVVRVFAFLFLYGSYSGPDYDHYLRHYCAVSPWLLVL